MSAVDDAWQAALAAEHQAAFGYPLLGPRLSGAQRDLARSCQRAHEALRDATAASLAAAGLTPVAPLGDYPALYPVPDAKAARALAIRLETECAAAWRYLYAAAAGEDRPADRALRAQAQAALTSSAVRATRWRTAAGTAPATVPFPGI